MSLFLLRYVYRLECPDAAQVSIILQLKACRLALSDQYREFSVQKN